MTIKSYASSLLPRWRRSQRRQTTRSAWHTCSRVSSAFFFNPAGVFGGKAHGEQTQAEVPHQRGVAGALKMSETEFRLGHSETVLHLPAILPSKSQLGWPTSTRA